MRTSTTTRPTTPLTASRGGDLAGRRATALGRISGWCFDHRMKAVGLWLLALFTIFGAAGTVGSRFSASSAVPGSGSASGFAVLEEHFPDLGAGGRSGTIVFKARQGVEDPEVRAAMQELSDSSMPGSPTLTACRSTRVAPSSHRTPSAAGARSPARGRSTRRSPTRR